MMNNGAPPAGYRDRDPNAILNDCREIDAAIDELDGRLDNLQRSFRSTAQSSDPRFGALNGDMAQLMDAYRGLVERVRKIKGARGSADPRNSAQVGRLDRKLKSSINRYQNIEAEFRREMRSASERQYRIVNPNATQEEVEQAVENPEAPVFQQAASGP
jgi:syntaxin 1B/2/3